MSIAKVSIAQVSTAVVSIVESRWRPAVLALLVVGAGIGVRRLTGGEFAKVAGDALYGTLVALLVLVVAPRLSPGRAAAIALALCWAVELAQLTPGPAALSARFPPARWVVGSSFNPADLAWYVLGVAPVAALRHWHRRVQSTADGAAA